MSNRIIVDQSLSNTAKMVARATNLALTALSELRRTKAVLDAAVYGAPATYSALAAELRAGMSDSDAQDAWTLISTALATVDVDAVRSLSRLDQG